MHVSNFRKVKRVEDVVHVFAGIRAKMSSKLLLIGDGPERYNVEQMCRQLGICGDIHFLGKTKKVNDLDIESNDFCFCIELPIKAKKKGMNILEIGCHERARIGGKKKVNAFKDGFLILIKMINLFFSRK